MNDPYTLSDGTLKNLLGITDYKELKRAEADIGFLKLIDIESIYNEDNFDTDLFMRIHRHIFSEIFDWAGKYRTVPLYKEERVIPGLSLDYAEPKKIDKLLKDKIKQLDSIHWERKSIQDFSLEFAKRIAAIWRVHPFRDGNTRTTLAFACLYAKEHGFPLNIEFLLKNLQRVEDENGRIIKYSIRDKFVLAALDEDCAPEPIHLAKLIEKAILLEQAEQKRFESR